MKTERERLYLRKRYENYMITVSGVISATISRNLMIAGRLMYLQKFIRKSSNELYWRPLTGLGDKLKAQVDK